MTYDSLYAIASQGLALEKLRVDVAANNLANQHKVLHKDGEHYTPMQVVARSKPFLDYLNAPEQGMHTAISLQPLKLAENKVYEPASAYADDKGFVRYPGISTLDEMLTLVSASRAYEANIKVMNTAHTLSLQALRIGE